MKLDLKSLITAALGATLLTATAVVADAGRYQAYWNGKSYMILDSDHGHIWTYFGDTIMYNGRIDSDDFESPEKVKIWTQSHGKWKQK